MISDYRNSGKKYIEDKRNVNMFIVVFVNSQVVSKLCSLYTKLQIMHSVQSVSSLSGVR